MVGAFFGYPVFRSGHAGKTHQKPVLALRRGDFQDATACTAQDAFGSRQAVKLASLGAVHDA